MSFTRIHSFVRNFQERFFGKAVADIRIVMTGPTGTGKTSLLAAMYPHLETQFPGGDYELVPTDETRTLLDPIRAQLSDLARGGGIVISGGGIDASKTPEEYNFSLQYVENNQKNTELSLQVFDLPGGCCIDNNGQGAKEKLLNSDTSFWCIDSVALMEPKSPDGQWIGKNHLSINQPEAMVNLLAQSNINDGHTVVIVLMRAEKYKDNKYAELFEQAKTILARYVIELWKNSKIDKVYYCAVETTGNVRYQRYLGEQKNEFIRDSSKEFSPEHCEIPVLCAVEAALEKAINQARWRYYRLSQILPFIRFRWFAPKSRTVANRLAERLEKPKAELQKHVESKELFEWYNRSRLF